MKLTDLDLLALQTGFMRNDETTRALCAALQPELIGTANSIFNLYIYKNIDLLQDNELSHKVLDELAWQFHLDYYDPNAPLSIKKGLIKQSVNIHRKKGTPQAVMDLLNTAFPADTLLLEWFDYGGEPYHFKIVTSSFENYNEDEFKKALNSVKNARSYLDSIDLFSLVWSYAKSKWTRNIEIEYKPVHIASVGGMTEYETQDASALAFEDGTTLSFYE